MKFEIDFHSKEERFYLYEYVGPEPVEYKCKASYCWRDCVPCCFCEAASVVIPDQEAYDKWKKRYNNRLKFPTSKEHKEYFQIFRNRGNGLIDENYFGMLDGEAVPIQLNLF